MIDQSSIEIAAFAQRLRGLRLPYPAEKFHGRGIVIAAGGVQIFTNAYVLVSLLRQTLGCALPIEVWHFGAQEMSHSMAALLREQDVAVVDAFPQIEAAGATVTDGWQLKPFALANSSFAEVLMLDADQVPVRDPIGLFETTEYIEAGAVFWPDVVGLRIDNPVWAALGLEPLQPELSIESGQLLIDKQRHWRALAMAIEISQQRDIAYHYLYGDKDAFLLAWLLAEAKYALVPHLPWQGERCLFQHDLAGAVLFQHRTNGKFAYATEEPPMEGFELLDACNAALRTLRQRWNGRIFWAPDRSVEARAVEATIAGQRHFRLGVVGSDKEDLELLPFGEFQVGRSAHRQNWWCEEREGRMELLFRDDERITYRLHSQTDGTWRGARLLYGEAVATLVPQVSATPHPPSSGLTDQLLAAAGFPDIDAADWERFTASVELLSRADPSLLVRLDEIAKPLGPQLASRLTTLVMRIRQRRTVRVARAAPGTLEKYYRRLDGDGSD